MQSSQPASKTVQPERKAYLKPRVEAVELRPKETMLGSCRSPSIMDNEGSAFACNAALTCRLEW